MILRVTLIQTICDQNRNDLPKTRDEINKKKSTSFASILENTIKVQGNNKSAYWYASI